MLSRSEQDTVLLTLADVLSAAESFKIFVQTTFTTNAKQLLLQLPTNLNRPQDQAACLLGCCLDSEWSLNPSLLEQLLMKLVDEGNAELASLRDRVHLQQPPPDDPFLRRWINVNMPFFDRDVLRNRVRPLLRGGDRPILCINGPEGSGKSYSHEFLDHLAEEVRRDLRSVYVRLEQGAGPSLPVEELADALVAPTNTSITGRPQRSTSYYPRTLLRWILNSAIQVPGTWLYILDGFDQLDVLPETRGLVQLLAQEISGVGEYRKRFRLILIDYKSKVSNVLEAKILSENLIDPALITEDQLVDCLEAHYKEQPPANGLQTDSAELRKVAEAWLAEARQLRPPSERLEFLYSKLYELRQASLPLPGAS